MLFENEKKFRAVASHVNETKRHDTTRHDKRQKELKRNKTKRSRTCTYTYKYTYIPSNYIVVDVYDDNDDNDDDGIITYTE